jgi:hypothetical protein
VAAWRDFELDIGELVRHFGYTGEVTPGSKDNGVDVLARKGDRVVAIQCKLYQGKVGSKAVQMLLASERLYGATDFILITTGRFTREARDIGARTGVKMIGGQQVLQLCKDRHLILRSSSFIQYADWTIPLDRDEYVVGRGDKCNIPIGDIHVSSQHADIGRNGLQVTIADLGSLNGTKLNGRRLEPLRPYVLNYSDVLHFGGIEAKISMFKNTEPPPMLVR